MVSLNAQKCQSARKTIVCNERCHLKVEAPIGVTNKNRKIDSEVNQLDENANRHNETIV